MANSAEISASALDDNLRTHLIEPALLRADDFEAFIEARSRAILKRIEEAMGKPAMASTLPEPDTPIGYEEMDLDDDE